MDRSPVKGLLDPLMERRAELLLAIRELEGQLASAKRQLGDVLTEIDSVRRVDEELLRRHPELLQLPETP